MTGRLKLASGMSTPYRLRDLADVQDLIVRLKPPLTLAGQRVHKNCEAAQSAVAGVAFSQALCYNMTQERSDRSRSCNPWKVEKRCNKPQDKSNNL